MAEVAAALAGALVLLTALRAGLALRALRADRPVAALPDGSVTVLQAIRSGDPLMPGHLTENLQNEPGAHFVWLVDEDDPAGVHAAREAAAAAPSRVEVVVTPPLTDGRNPKVAKLVLGLPRCGDVLAVLDDDTVLPPGALARAVAGLAHGAVVTGVPVYREQGSLWSRLVAAFVNGGSLLTYLPMSVGRAPVTLNGMFYVTRRPVLEGLGGFRAIEHLLCDDYEIARLYRRAGLSVVQSTVVHPLATTVRGPGHYGRLMRRWMVFTRQVLGADPSPRLLLLVVLPGVLPAAAALAAAFGGSPTAGAVVAGALAVKAVVTAAVRHRVGAPTGARGVLLEPVADLLLPLHLLAAAIRPGRVVWRDRRVETTGRTVARVDVA